MAAEIIFICGGVRSGKSSFAESKAASLAADTHGASLHYIACGKAVDEEMELRINRHKKEREDSETVWTTWEQPLDVGLLAGNFTSKDIVLLDCLTTLLTNEMFGNGFPCGEKVGNKVVVDIKKIASSAGALLLVTNDIFCEPMGSLKSVKAFMQTLGKVHQKLAALSSEAYSVNNGIPVLKKERQAHTL